MAQLRQMLNKLLFPGRPVMGLTVLVAAVGLGYTFLLGRQDSPAAYVAYVVSAYALTIVCAGVPGLVRGGSVLVHKQPYLHRYLTDIPFRTRMSLYMSLTVNLLYAAIKLASGVYYRSVWFVTLAVYYMLLAVMRYALLHHVNRNPVGQNLMAELRRYRLCGVALLGINLALSGVVVLVLHQDEGFTYPGFLIYAMAAYAFYVTITAVVNVVKYRRHGSPVMSAAKIVNLAAALVSMLSLETAMLDQFGGADDLMYRKSMTAATGAVVCAIILVTAVYMIVHATRKLCQIQSFST